jgi:hypothetical protein
LRNFPCPKLDSTAPRSGLWCREFDLAQPVEIANELTILPIAGRDGNDHCRAAIVGVKHLDRPKFMRLRSTRSLIPIKSPDRVEITR